MNESQFKMDKVDGRLADMYTSDENKQQKYDRWADSYESDLVNELDYVAHIDAANLFRNLVVDDHAKILDVACGTGLVGAELRGLGYTNVDGCDFSMEMVRISRERQVYGEVFQYDVSKPLVHQGRYDALICVGLFSFSIPKITDMINVINAVKPDGSCVITVNGAAWNSLQLEGLVYQEASKHGFHIDEVVQAGYIRKENIDSRILVIRSPG